MGMDTEDANEARTLLAALALLWPEIRQLHDGFMNGDPNFTAWDHSVRNRVAALTSRLDRWRPDWRDKPAMQRAKEYLEQYGKD